MARRLLMTWIGHTDIRAMAVALPAKDRTYTLESIGARDVVQGNGPIKTLVDQREFDEIHLLCDCAPRVSRQFVKWLARPVVIHHVTL
jgi:hypothetical protein